MWNNQQQHPERVLKGVRAVPYHGRELCWMCRHHKALYQCTTRDKNSSFTMPLCSEHARRWAAEVNVTLPTLDTTNDQPKPI